MSYQKNGFFGRGVFRRRGQHFLLKIAHDVLQDRAIAVTAGSSTYPEREFKEAAEFTRSNGIKHIVIQSEELEIKGFTNNPSNRCYLCKYELFSKIKEVAKNIISRTLPKDQTSMTLMITAPGCVRLKNWGLSARLEMPV